MQGWPENKMAATMQVLAFKHRYFTCMVVNSTRLKTVRSARWCCPNSTMAPKLLGNVVKVTNLKVVKIEFRHLPFLLLSSFFSQPSALTRAVPRTKRPPFSISACMPVRLMCISFSVLHEYKVTPLLVCTIHYLIVIYSHLHV